MRNTPEVGVPLVPSVVRSRYGGRRGMSTSQHESSVSEEHAAPPEAWDAIAEGYDRYVAPQEVDLANDALRLVGLESGERFLDVAAGTGA